MAIIVKPPQPPMPWAQALSPLTQVAMQHLAQQRQQQQNISEGTILNKVISDVLNEKGENASMVDFLKAFSQAQQQGVRPETIESQLIKPFGTMAGLEEKRALQEHRLSEKRTAEQQKAQAKLEPYIYGLENLGRMREILQKHNLGPKSGITSAGWQTPRLFAAMSPEGQKDRAEYERLGKSLISLSTTIPIRNRLEFETLANSLYDPSMTESQIAGNLDAMERILSNRVKSEIPQELQSQEMIQTLPKTSERSQGGEVIVREKKTGKRFRYPREHLQHLPKEEFEVNEQPY